MNKKEIELLKKKHTNGVLIGFTDKIKSMLAPLKDIPDEELTEEQSGYTDAIVEMTNYLGSILDKNNT